MVRFTSDLHTLRIGQYLILFSNVRLLIAWAGMALVRGRTRRCVPHPRAEPPAHHIQSVTSFFPLFCIFLYKIGSHRAATQTWNFCGVTPATCKPSSLPNE